MTSPKRIDVALRFSDNPVPVGSLATDTRNVYFEYHPAFIERQLHLSPFMLPLTPGLQRINDDIFNGLPGVFNDSLPDGWGKLLLHQELKQRGINPSTLGPLDELAMVGDSGMGALTYPPAHPLDYPPGIINLDSYAAASRHVLEGHADHMLPELRAAAGSSSGARPKVLVTVSKDRSRLSTALPTTPDEEQWLVKFPTSADGADAGAIEYVYSLMARAAGITMEPCHLFPSTSGAGYFGTRRFDRNNGDRLHVHSLSGLIHDDHRHPSFDYSGLLAVTQKITLNPNDVQSMFRLAAFNVLAHNRDDHSKNFSFIMHTTGRWQISPAYDLTFSSGPNGFQSMSVMGEARSPTISDLKNLGSNTGIRPAAIADILLQVSDALTSWTQLARAHGVSQTNIALIERTIMRNILAKAH